MLEAWTRCVETIHGAPPPMVIWPAEHVRLVRCYDTDDFPAIQTLTRERRTPDELMACILLALCRRPDRLCRLATRTALTRVTIHRYLHLMHDAGLLIRDDDLTWHLAVPV